jgi:hypothetical protein
VKVWLGGNKLLLRARDTGKCSALAIAIWDGPHARRMAPELARSLRDDSLHFEVWKVFETLSGKKLGCRRRSPSRRNFRRAITWEMEIIYLRE